MSGITTTATTETVKIYAPSDVKYETPGSTAATFQVTPHAPTPR